MQEQRASEIQKQRASRDLQAASKKANPQQRLALRIAQLGEENGAQENSFGHRVNTRAARRAQSLRASRLASTSSTFSFESKRPDNAARPPHPSRRDGA